MSTTGPRLSPFGPEQRPDVIARLVNDAAVQDAIDAEQRETGGPRDAIVARARTYAGEIVPQFSARLHHRIAYRLARRVATAFFRVRVGHVDEATMAEIPEDASVAFVINHRSNMDYVLVAFLAAEQVALSFAVGEWARIWPLDNLLRGLGAFFVRRDSHDRLYRKVLECYVHQAIAHGVTQGIFPEGGLSRDGRLRAPKLGLLSYATRHFDVNGPRDLVFVPVGLNYDRVLEDRNLLRDLEPGRITRSKLGTIAMSIVWMAKNATLYARGRLYRFGYACVNFGPPLSLRSYLSERQIAMAGLSDAQRGVEIERLAGLLMEEIGRVIPITPVSLVASAMLSFDDHAASPAALSERVGAMVEELSSQGAHVYLPRQDAQYFLEVGVRMLTLRRLLTLDGGVYRVMPGEAPLVRYYANAIAHFFATRTERPAQPPPATSAPGTRAVILVHGLARTSRSMAHLGEALRRAGYSVWNWDYPSRKFGIMALVDALEIYARDVSRWSARVDFVTNSMGGLLARGVLSRNTIGNAGRLVMLAPPNQGSQMASRVKEYRLAREFFGQAIEDLSRTSAIKGVLQDLGSPACPFGVVAGTRSFHPLQPTSYYSRLAGRHEAGDGTVAVQETHLPGMTDFVTVPANHTFIADHEEAIRQTLHFLEHGRFDHGKEGGADSPTRTA